jgi:predicted transcriptional regulator
MRGFELQKRRHELGWSIFDLAKAADVSPALVEAWERGSVPIGDIASERLEDVLEEAVFALV